MQKFDISQVSITEDTSLNVPTVIQKNQLNLPVLGDDNILRIDNIALAIDLHDFVPQNEPITLVLTLTPV